MTNQVVETDEASAPWRGRVLAQIVLTLPCFSPFRWSSGWLNRRLCRAGGQPFTATAHDGAKLDAIFLPAKENNPCRLPVIMSHGYTEIKEFHARHTALLQEDGHDIVLHDLRAHGKSGGRFTSLGALETQDLTSVIDEATRQGFVEGKVITRGYSTSAAIAIQHAPTDQRVADVIAIAPYADLVSAIKSFRKLLGNFYNEEKFLHSFAHLARRRGFRFDDAMIHQALKQFKVPVLLVAGTADRNLPPQMHDEQLSGFS